MVLTVNVAYNMEIVKIAKLTKVIGEKGRLQVWSRKRLTITLYVFTSSNIFIIFNVRVDLTWGCKSNKTYQDSWWKLLVT